MITNPHHLVALRRALLGRNDASKRVVCAAVRYDGRRAALDDVDWDLEGAGKGLDLYVSGRVTLR